MSNYFEEHDCRPLGQGEQPDHLMHIARLLIDTGMYDEVKRLSTYRYFKDLGPSSSVMWF